MFILFISPLVSQLQVLVMTPAILLDALRRSFLNLSMIKVLIVDECHHAGGKHPYACIMRVSMKGYS